MEGSLEFLEVRHYEVPNWTVGAALVVVLLLAAGFVWVRWRHRPRS